MKKILAVFCVVVTAALFTGCGSSKSGSNGAGAVHSYPVAEVQRDTVALMEAEQALSKNGYEFKVLQDPVQVVWNEELLGTQATNAEITKESKIEALTIFVAAAKYFFDKYVPGRFKVVSESGEDLHLSLDPQTIDAYRKRIELAELTIAQIKAAE